MTPATSKTGMRVETKDDRELDLFCAEPMLSSLLCTCRSINPVAVGWNKSSLRHLQTGGAEWHR